MFPEDDNAPETTTETQPGPDPVETVTAPEPEVHSAVIGENSIDAEPETRGPDDPPEGEYVAIGSAPFESEDFPLTCPECGTGVFRDGKATAVDPVTGRPKMIRTYEHGCQHRFGPLPQEPDDPAAPEWGLTKDYNCGRANPPAA